VRFTKTFDEEEMNHHTRRRSDLVLAVFCGLMAFLVPIIAIKSWIARHPDSSRSQAEMLFDYAEEKLSLSAAQIEGLSAGVREVHSHQDPFYPDARILYPVAFFALSVFHLVRYFSAKKRTESNQTSTANDLHTD